MKAKDLRGFSTEELNSKLAAFREELFRQRFQGATEQVQNPGKIRTARKDIARIRTLLHARALGRETESSGPAKKS